MTILSRVPSAISEEIQFLTEILNTRDDTEQRISVRGDPRVKMSMTFPTLTENERISFSRDVALFINGQVDMPLWQWATQVTAAAITSDTNLYFNNQVTPVKVGSKIAVLDGNINYLGQLTVSATASGFVTASAPLGFNVPLGSFVCPLITGYTSDAATLKIDSKISEYNLAATAYAGFDLEVNPTFSLTTYNSLPILLKRPKTGTEVLSFSRQYIDYQSGSVDIFDHGLHHRLQFDRTYLVDRLSAADIQFWRAFMNYTKGAWKPFLVPTWMPDFKVASLIQNGTYFEADLNEYSNFSETYETFKRVQIEYDDGSFSYHTITGQSTVSTKRRFTVTPNIPNDPKVANFRKISRLLKAYTGDTFQLNHGNVFSDLTLLIRTTDFG